MSDGVDPFGFPCEAVPREPAAARLLGIYPQRGGDLLMQRVKVPEGRIRPDQWRALAILAARHTPDYPLHVTTRQDVELHGLRAADVPAVQRGFAEVGLTSAAACGDAVRNVTMCPGSGMHAGSWDLTGVAAAIRRFVDSLPWAGSLPRKFKISLSGCPRACGRPWINDLGLTANEDGTFSAVLAGSLGPHPAAGQLLYESLPLGDVLPLVGAALGLFHAEGQRERRGQARLRHLRQQLGDDVFRGRIDALMRQEGDPPASPMPRPVRVQCEVPLWARLALPLGDLAADVALELADLVEASGAELRLGLQHDLFLFGGIPRPLGPALEAMVGRPTVVACPGATWCTRGIADSRAAARRILAAVPDDCGLSIAVAGCPNNCPHAAVAGVGLIGRIRQIDGRRVECFRVLVGGGNGQTPELAREVHAAVPADTVHETVARLVADLSRAGRIGQTPPLPGEAT